MRARAAGSHSNKGWEQFTDRVVDVIDRYGGANLGRKDGECTESQRLGVSRGVVFLAWGSWAQKRVARLDKVPQFVYSKDLHLTLLRHVWYTQTEEASYLNERRELLRPRKLLLLFSRVFFLFSFFFPAYVPRN